VACGASGDYIGVVELGIVKDASQVTAMERTFKGGIVEVGENLKITESPLSVCRVVSTG
jgi:hypothetical protein